jgi:hypothetical protein
VRSAAQQTGISKSTVGRYFALFGVQPHRTKGFKLSNDPFFVEKVRDIVGLYLSPPANALVLCVDEKSQCQALERTQRLLPMGLGYLEGVSHDYVRHGTTTLFAALNAATGEVFAQCKARLDIRNSSPFSTISSGQCLLNCSCTSSWIIMPPTSIPRNKKNPLGGISANKRLVPMPRQLNKHLLNPVSALFMERSVSVVDDAIDFLKI